MWSWRLAMRSTRACTAHVLASSCSCPYSTPSWRERSCSSSPKSVRARCCEVTKPRAHAVSTTTRTKFKRVIAGSGKFFGDAQHRAPRAGISLDFLGAGPCRSTDDAQIRRRQLPGPYGEALGQGRPRGAAHEVLYDAVLE